MASVCHVKFMFPIQARAHYAMDGSSNSINKRSSASRKRVCILWDLDNKPPKCSPYEVALHLRNVASQFGEVVRMLAYGNRYTFLHVPRWVQHQQRQTHPNPVSNSTTFICPFCGSDCANNSMLKKHLKSFHRHENRSKSHMMLPLAGYGLGLELRKAGFSVRIVDDSPQAADRAIKRQIKHSMDNGIQCIWLISDDSGFGEILKAARSKQMCTVVIGDTVSLQQFADAWYLWDDIVPGKDVVSINPRNVITDLEGSQDTVIPCKKNDKFHTFYDFTSQNEDQWTDVSFDEDLQDMNDLA